MKSANAKDSYRPQLLDATCATVLIAYFLYFALPALRAGFREDEMMNMGVYWCAGSLKSLWANIAFWKLSLCPANTLYDLSLYLYRPGGALYYLPLYHFFGLDPLPYRIVQIGILAATIPLACYLSRHLTSARPTAFLAVLAFCYHPRLAGLVFIGAFIYDVLCGFFYLAAFAYYIHIRENDLPLRPTQSLVFLALYVCALNCKEMAVSLPVIVLIYELLKSPRWVNWKVFWHSVRSHLALPLIAGLLTAFYIHGKLHGNGSLASLEPYRPQYSWHNFIASNARFVGELLFTGHTITPIALLTLWAVVFIYAFTRHDRTLQLMAFWVVIVPFPLAFIVPVRGDASLYLLLFGWAMIFATIVFDLIILISKLSISHGKSVVRSAAIGDGSTKTSTRSFQIIATLLVAFALAIVTLRENRPIPVRWLSVGAKTSHVIQAYRSLSLHPIPGSRILLLLKENLFQNKWNALFIGSLVWNDHSLRIWVERADQLTPQQQTSVDYIISVSEFDAHVIRSPELPKSN